MAAGEGAGKLSIVRIIQILLRESDEDHPMTQQEIVSQLEEKYGMTVNRKSVGRNLNRLKDAGLPVNCREVTRMMNGKQVPLSLDWYWDHAMNTEELTLLSDLLYFSHLPQSAVRQLSEKLRRLHSRSFDDGKGNIRNLPAPMKAAKPEALLSVIGTALSKKKKIAFYYDHYEADGKRHHDRTPSGEDRRYILSPFAVVASDDRYILLGNPEGSISLAAYFIDRISEEEILEEAAVQQKDVPLAAGEKLVDYLYRQSAVYTGFPEICSFEADSRLLSEIMTDFGKSAHLVSAQQDRVTVEVMCPCSAMKAWALARAPLVKILSPAYLVKESKEAADELSRLYDGL